MNCLVGKLRIQESLVGNFSGDYALTTLPLRMQEVHTRMRLVVAPTRACTGRRFTFQRRLVTLWAWLMRFPDCGFLPQISHCCAMTAADPFRGLEPKLLFYRIRLSPTIRCRLIGHVNYHGVVCLRK